MLPPASLPVRPRAQRDELRKQAFSGGLRAAGPIQEEQQAGPEGVEAVDEQLVAEEECGDGFSCEDRPVASGHGAGAPLPSWDAYWDARQEVDVPSRWGQGPGCREAAAACACVHLHGTGTPLTDRARRGGRFNVYAAGALGPVILCCHGGGYTGLTWSLMAAHLKDKWVQWPGHGTQRAEQRAIVCSCRSCAQLRVKHQATGARSAARLPSPPCARAGTAWLRQTCGATA